MLAQMLKTRRYDGVPSKSTVTAILRRHGLIDPAESSRGILKKCVNGQAVYPLSEQDGLKAQERRYTAYGKEKH